MKTIQNCAGCLEQDGDADPEPNRTAPNRRTGRVIHVNPKKFGFIQVEGLDRDVWFSFTRFRRAERTPKIGDEVEFDLIEFSDGRLQAGEIDRLSDKTVGAETQGSGKRVSLVSPLRVAAAIRSPSRDDERESRENFSAPDPARVEVSVESSNSSVVESASGQVAKAVAKHLKGRDDVWTALIERARMADTACSDLERGIEEFRREMERRLEELRAALALESEKSTDAWREAESASVTRDDVCGASVEVLAEIRVEWTSTLSKRAELLRKRDAARRAAVLARNTDEVSQYEEVRDRLRNETDRLLTAALSRLENERRQNLSGYAEAIDHIERAPVLEIPMVVFHENDRLVIVIPLGSVCDHAPGDDLSWRVVSAASHVAVRAVSEISSDDATLEFGTVSDCFAAQIRGKSDAALLDLLIEDAMRERPTLIDSRITLIKETAPPLPFSPAHSVNTPIDPGKRSTGGTLAQVSGKLGLAVHETVSLLHDLGLPFQDDVLNFEGEETLFRILGFGDSLVETRGARAKSSEDGSRETTDGNIGLAIASRVLSKLFRDTRIGARHTRVENVYAHGFADYEKSIARQVVKQLIALDVLLPKLNEGSQHVSINPRRRTDVLGIINMEARFAALFD